ncbi:MAG: hypothetical protein IKW33_05130 [Clostridia bacterium]|nr:hypothetical protein [Clostridia bacterium]
MNSLGRNNEQNNEKQPIFTKETMGVVLILFSTLATICLITRETLFSLPGQYINAFLFGCFGYFAYVLCLFLIFIGVLLVVGKKTNVSAKNKFYVTSFVVLLALLLHTISMSGADVKDFAEYLTLSYTMAEGGIATTSAGGLIVGLVAYPITLLLTNVGAYVALGLLIVLDAYAFIDGLVKDYSHKRPAVKGEKFKSSYVAKDSKDEISNLPIKDYPIEDVDLNNYDKEEKPTQKLFVIDPQKFYYKSRKELKTDTGKDQIKLNKDQKGLNIASIPQNYQDGYVEDIKEKIDYIKKPAEIDLEKTLNNDKYRNSNTPTTTISTPISNPSIPSVEEKKDEIPFIEHSADKPKEAPVEDSTKDRADRFADKYMADDNYDPLTASMKEDVYDIEDNEPTYENPSYQPPIEEKIQHVEETYTPFEEEKPVETETRARRLFEALNDKKEVEEEKPVETPVEEIEENPIGFGRGRNRILPTENVIDDLEEDTYIPPVEEKVIETAKPIVEEIKEEPKKEIPPINREYFSPPLDLLETHTPPSELPQEDHEGRKEAIRAKLEEFGINVEPQDHIQGPSITRYEIKMPAGVSVKKVLSYDDDLQMALLVKNGIRIEAPIPGKNLVGIEVANKVKVMVGLKEVLMGMAGQNFKPDSLVFALGKDIVGESKYDDLTKGPHYLIAGSSGSGKSVCLNVMIVSLLMRYSPEELRFILIDPKRVEMRKYEHIPHLMVDEIITDPKKTLAVLQWAIEEMERRYEMFEKAGSYVDGIAAYNQYVASNTVPKMPKIVIVIDEFGDLMANIKKDLEVKIQILTQKARAAGIHIVLATQRPSANVVTGVIKTNLPSRIAFKVGNYTDSLIILDSKGAEKLLGNGDMLYKNSTMSETERYQGAFISGTEVYNVVKYIIENNKAYFDDDLANYLERATAPKVEETAVTSSNDDSPEVDDTFLKALAFAINSGTISISALQRRFTMGYPRAGGIIDKMEVMKFISPNEGSKARRVLITREEFIERFGSMPENYV